MNCGNCLADRVKIVKLNPAGTCPACGAQYGAAGIDQPRPVTKPSATSRAQSMLCKERAAGLMEEIKAARRPAPVETVAQKYDRAKKDKPLNLALIKSGDFYEALHDDAKCVARVIGLTLTTMRGAVDVPMCGFPAHSAPDTIARLLRNGFTVSVIE